MKDISKEEIISSKLVCKEEYEKLENYTRMLYEKGSEYAYSKNLLLVDTKYEFGKLNGDITLIDEIHTPDSSRYLVAEGYNDRIEKNEEPQNIDKEFLRLWFVDNCDPYNDDTLPEAPLDLVAELSSRYIYLYETITGSVFPFPNTGKPIQNRINENIEEKL